MIDENITTLNEAIEKDASASDAYVKRGAARVILYAYTSALRTDAESLLEQAVEDFTKAIDLDQSNASAYIGRGEAYDQWKRMDEGFPRLRSGNQASRRFTESRCSKRRCSFQSGVRL